MLSQSEIEKSREQRVVKSNLMAREARYRLSLQAQRVLLFLISKIQKDDSEFVKQEFSAIEFCEVAGIEPGGAEYKQIEGTLTELFSANGWITLPNGMRTPLSWIERPFRDPESGRTWVKLDDVMRPFLLQLRDNFTQYALGYAMRFRSKYSIRLYEMLSSYQYTDNTFSKVCDLDKLRNILDAENYEQYKDFKKRALVPAVNEINEFSDKNISMKELKSGRKVTGIEFTISTKQGSELEAVQQEAGLPRRRKPRGKKELPPTAPKVPGRSEESSQDMLKSMQRLYEGIGKRIPSDRMEDMA